MKGHRIAASSDKDAAAMTAEAFGGQRVKNWRIHYYEVIDRQETATIITVICEYRDSEKWGE